MNVWNMLAKAEANSTELATTPVPRNSTYR